MVSFAKYQKLGFTTVSNALLLYYHKLNINEVELALLLHLESFNQKNNRFPSDEMIANRMNFNAIQVSQLIQQLIDKKLIELKQQRDENKRITNYYDLSMLYEKLDTIVDKATYYQTIDSVQLDYQTTDSPLQNIIRQFEIEFGRLLSPIEKQQISSWLVIDHYKPEIINLALRESVLSQVYNFKYIDRILLNWQRHNLTDIKQVKAFLTRY